MFSFLSTNILTRAFWGDEAWSALISSLPIVDLITTTASDFHPPLYYLILHFWINLVGSGEVAIRLVSLFFWSVSGLTTYFLSRCLGMSKLWALLSAMFVLFNPFIFVYAFEARNYTLFIFLSLLSMWQFQKILNGQGKAIVYLTLSVLGLYTHYYMFFIVGGQFLLVVLTRRDLWKKFLLLGVGFFVGYLPWLPFFFSQTKSVVGGYWIAPVTYEAIRDTAKVLIRGEQYTRFANELPLYFSYFLIIAAVKAFFTHKLLSKTTLLLILWFGVPFFTPVLLSQIRPIFFYRYLVIAAVPIMILALWWSSEVGKTKTVSKFFLALSLIFLAVFLYTDFVAFKNRSEENFRPLLKAIKSQPNDSPIFTTLPSFAEVVYYNNNYYGKPLEVRVIPKGLAQASGKALLDTYIKKGYVTLAEPPINDSYWLLEPGPKSIFITN